MWDKRYILLQSENALRLRINKKIILKENLCFISPKLFGDIGKDHKDPRKAELTAF